MKIGRNDPCPCGSGLKYKKCCLGKEKEERKFQELEATYFKKYGIRLKHTKDIEGIKRAGIVALKTLDLVESSLRPGMKTD